MELLLALLGSSTMGGVISAMITRRYDREDRRRDELRADVHAAQDRLGDLRRAYRRRAANAPDAPDDFALAELTDDFTMAVSRTLSGTVVDVARRYVDVGNLYAAGDTDTGVALEQAAFERLADALIHELDAARTFRRPTRRRS
jgi:hypothetical protein